MIIIIVALAISSILLAAWFITLCSANQDDWMAAGYARIYSNMLKIQKLKRKDEQKEEELSQLDGIEAKIRRAFAGKGNAKTIAALESQNTKIQGGDFGPVSVFEIPGYVAIRKFEAIAHSDIYKNILKVFFEVYGRKYAEHLSKQLLAQMLSYAVLGVGAVLAGGAMLAIGMAMDTGLMVMGLGSVLVLVVVYALYDEVSSTAKKRQDSLERQFPNVVSKLALLVTSGMILDAAWKLTAYSSDKELFMEMRKTSQDREQNMAPEIAYDGFVQRCNTKETSKLASAILQNLSKGNAELGRLLKDMAKESWSERKHLAKRDAEKANGKLLIPTMLLLIVVLMMVMAPMLIGFDMGF